ncbi:MAG TPA: hypothetical protein PLQ65_15485 [Flavihumibacter sp.]|nr:hypothetical protein [Flavihumibacter sp.]
MQDSVRRKAAFFMNLAFLTAMLMRFYPVGQGTVWASMIISAGLVLSPILNLLTSLRAGWVIWKKGWPVDKWVVMVNFSMLLVQIILLSFTGWLSLGNAYDS